MEVATGTQEQHPTPLPLDPQPPVAAQTPRFPSATGRDGDQGGVYDATTARLDQAASYADMVASAQSAGVAAEADRRAGYHQNALTVGPSDALGDPVDLTGLVYDYALPPASQPGLYPFPGDEPTATS